MRNKSDTFNCFKIFRAHAEKHTGTKLKSLNVINRPAKSAAELKILRTDNGGVYIQRVQVLSSETRHSASAQRSVYSPAKWSC